MQAIKTPGTIWAKLIEQNNVNQKKPDGRGDAFCYFVGSRGAGKSTLLNRFLYPSRAEAPKPSEGLEYTYARKPSQFDHEKKDLAHIWEIAGSLEFADEISKGDSVILNVKQVTTATIVIVLDLSDPSSVLPTATYWLDQIKKKLTNTYEKFEKKGLQLPEQLRARAKSKLYSTNEDKDAVYHSGIAVVIVAAKYDTFKDADPEIKKVVARSLRFLAHAHGAFLLYVAGLDAAGDSSRPDGPQEKSLLENFSRLMNHLIFTGLEKKPVLKMPPHTDHQGPLMVPAGMDTFADIGRPRGQHDGNIPAGVAEWQELFDKMFPNKVAKEKAAHKFVVDPRYKEDDVDKARVRKAEDLANYLKEQIAAEEARKKKIAMAKAKSTQRDKDRPRKSKPAA